MKKRQPLQQAGKTAYLCAEEWALIAYLVQKLKQNLIKDLETQTETPNLLADKIGKTIKDIHKAFLNRTLIV